MDKQLPTWKILIQEQHFEQLQESWPQINNQGLKKKTSTKLGSNNINQDQIVSIRQSQDIIQAQSHEQADRPASSQLFLLKSNIEQCSNLQNSMVEVIYDTQNGDSQTNNNNLNEILNQLQKQSSQQGQGYEPRPSIQILLEQKNIKDKYKNKGASVNEQFIKLCKNVVSLKNQILKMKMSIIAYISKCESCCLKICRNISNKFENSIMDLDQQYKNQQQNSHSNIHQLQVQLAKASQQIKLKQSQILYLLQQVQNLKQNHSKFLLNQQKLYEKIVSLENELVKSSQIIEENEKSITQMKMQSIKNQKQRVQLTNQIILKQDQILMITHQLQVQKEKNNKQLAHTQSKKQQQIQNFIKEIAKQKQIILHYKTDQNCFEEELQKMRRQKFHKNLQTNKLKQEISNYQNYVNSLQIEYKEKLTYFQAQLQKLTQYISEHQRQKINTQSKLRNSIKDRFDNDEQFYRKQQNKRQQTRQLKNSKLKLSRLINDSQNPKNMNSMVESYENKTIKRVLSDRGLLKNDQSIIRNSFANQQVSRLNSKIIKIKTQLIRQINQFQL